MLRAFHSTFSTNGFAFRQVRTYVALVETPDLRTRLTHDIKAALKVRDAPTASTLRSVLADMQAADKVHKDGRIDTRAIRLIVANGIARRHDAASRYDKANRPELANKERLEAEILQKFLPTNLSDSQIDETLKKVVASLSIPRPPIGQIFKSFYTLVDKSDCPPNVLKRRIQELGLTNPS